MNGQNMDNKQTKTLTLVGSIYFKPKQTFQPFGWIEIPADRESFWNHSIEYILVAPYTIEIEMPEGFDPKQETLKALQIERKLILANNEQRLNEVDSKIQELMAIEHKTE
jgi:hypothetical protein